MVMVAAAQLPYSSSVMMMVLVAAAAAGRQHSYDDGIGDGDADGSPAAGQHNYDGRQVPVMVVRLPGSSQL